MWRVVTVLGTGTFAVFKCLSSLRNYMTNFIHWLSHISTLLPFFKADHNIHTYMIPATDVVTSKQDREWWEN
jgi:hypothetical protein